MLLQQIELWNMWALYRNETHLHNAFDLNYFYLTYKNVYILIMSP